MLEVIRGLYTLHQHIIDVNLHGAPDQVFKILLTIAGMWVLRSRVRRDYFVTVDSPTSGEGRFVFVWWVHLDLIVAKIGVHEAKELVARRCSTS